MQRWLTILGGVLLLLPVHAEGGDDLPKNIRVTVEYIEASHALVTELMAGPHADSGPKLHASVRALVQNKQARIIETSMVAAKSGEKAVAESIMEYIYPTEYDPDDYRWLSAEQQEALTKKWATTTPLRPTQYTAFETRNTGVTLEIEPTLRDGTKLIDLRFAPEIVSLLRLDTVLEFRDRWGDASIRFPVFETLRTSTTTTLQDREFGFIGVLTPNSQGGGTDTTRKIMLFVRADILPIGP